MSSVIEHEPTFTQESWQTLDRIEQFLKRRVLNLLADRVLQTKRTTVNNEDVEICFRNAAQELVEQLDHAAE